MDIQVGDRVTYIDKQGKKCIVIVLEDKGELSDGSDNLISEILKIERPQYREIEVKKDLLTEEEKEFLRQCKKLNNSINNIQSFENTIYLIDEDRDENVFTLKDIHKNLFKKLKDGHVYTLKELGLEED